jgi:hypothetical protein
LTIPRQLYENKIKELAYLTDLKFELEYNENGDEYTFIKLDNEILFGGRDGYADLVESVGLCYKTRQKAFRDFKEPTYMIKGVL